MLKYLYCRETFQEIPDELTLSISVSNCQIKCKGCHQPELWKDVGTTLDIDTLTDLLQKHKYVSCVCILGSGNKEYKDLNKLGALIRCLGYKSAVYLGEDNIPEELDISVFDFIKIGHWDISKGGLNSPTTNQKFYLIESNGDGTYYQHLLNYKFRNHEN